MRRVRTRDFMVCNIYTDQLLVWSNFFVSSNLIPLTNEAIVFSLPWEIPTISKCCTWTNVERCLLLISIPTYLSTFVMTVCRSSCRCSWWKTTLCSRLKICWQSLAICDKSRMSDIDSIFFLMEWCFGSLMRKKN